MSTGSLSYGKVNYEPAIDKSSPVEVAEILSGDPGAPKELLGWFPREKLLLRYTLEALSEPWCESDALVGATQLPSRAAW